MHVYFSIFTREFVIKIKKKINVISLIMGNTVFTHFIEYLLIYNII